MTTKLLMTVDWKDLIPNMLKTSQLSNDGLVEGAVSFDRTYLKSLTASK